MAYVGLLRGINVGGRNKLAMSDLKSLATGLGLENVSTYLNTGNLLFSSRPTKKLAADLSAAIEAHNGLTVPVVIASGARVAAAIERNPFSGSDPKQLLVYFCDPTPTKSAIASLDLNRSPGDSLAVVDSEIYLQLPNGAQKTKFTLGYLEKTLGVTATSRNLNTTTKLASLLEAD